MEREADIPRLICELCRQFYELGWVSGTGGGISIRDEAGIYMAPSGVQKERIDPADVYLLDGAALDRCEVLQAPASAGLKISECQPLFYNAYRDRDAGAVIHSHSIWAVLAARLASPSGEAGVFATEGLEMQKGLRGKGCFERVEVPIIANTAREAELTESMAAAMRAHPDVDAVIVAGHGVYVWGATWVKAKTQAECYDYLFRAAVEAHRVGLPLASSTIPLRPVAGQAQGIDPMKLEWLEPAAGQAPCATEDLNATGVVHERLEVDPEAYQPPLDRLKAERGYLEQDIVELRPDTPKLDEICAKFVDEHLHTDDEVRYVLEGDGIFDIRSVDDRWMRVTVEQGDLLVVPANVHHRFMLTERKHIRCVRLFKDSAGWVPHYRDQAR